MSIESSRDSSREKTRAQARTQVWSQERAQDRAKKSLREDVGGVMPCRALLDSPASFYKYIFLKK